MYSRDLTSNLFSSKSLDSQIFLLLSLETKFFAKLTYAETVVHMQMLCKNCPQMTFHWFYTSTMYLILGNKCSFHWIGRWLKTKQQMSAKVSLFVWQDNNNKNFGFHLVFSTYLVFSHYQIQWKGLKAPIDKWFVSIKIIRFSDFLLLFSLRKLLVESYYLSSYLHNSPF